MKEISSFNDLVSIKSDGNYELTKNINCNGENIYNLLGSFTGTIDGKGFTISNFKIFNKIIGDGLGTYIFHTMTGATIKNINFDLCNINIDVGPYKPKLAFLAKEVDNSIFSNINIRLETTNQNVYFIYDCCDCKLNNISFIVNGKTIKKLCFYND